MKTIIICDDHPFTLIGTKSFVEGLNYRVIDLCSNGISAYNSIMKQEPMIALLDLNMPGMSGLEVAEKLQKQHISTHLILLTMHNERGIFLKAQELKIKGYLLKEFALENMKECLIAVEKGETWFKEELMNGFPQSKSKPNPTALDKLTNAEKKILKLIAEKKTSKDIAQLLFISEKTVENHRSNIMKKLELTGGTNALLLWAIQNIPNP